MVNGGRVPYVRNSRHEAKLASQILSRALGRTIDVAGIIVPVGACDVVIKQSPGDVHVVPRRQIAGWLGSQPNRLDPAAVSEVVRAARRSATWQPAA